MEDGNASLSMKSRSQHISIAFCVKMTQLFILLNLTTPGKMLLYLPSENICALFCFSSTIDKNTDTVNVIEGFFSNETVTY